MDFKVTIKGRRWVYTCDDNDNERENSEVFAFVAPIKIEASDYVEFSKPKYFDLLPVENRIECLLKLNRAFIFDEEGCIQSLKCNERFKDYLIVKYARQLVSKHFKENKLSALSVTVDLNFGESIHLEGRF